MRKHKVTMIEKLATFEYYPLNLESVIRMHIETFMRQKDWKIVAIDPFKDKVILERWEPGTEIIKDEEVSE